MLYVCACVYICIAAVSLSVITNLMPKDGHICSWSKKLAFNIGYCHSSNL